MKPVRALSLVTLATALAGCVSDGMCMWHCGDQHSGSTPLVEFLYPDGKVPPVDATPELKIPLTVGLSFLPSRGGYERLDATQKEQLLTSIKEHFRTRPYVRDIQIISGVATGAIRVLAGHPVPVTRRGLGPAAPFRAS